MNIDLTKTLKTLEKKLTPENGLMLADLYKVYDITLQLRSQLLGVIYEQETFGVAGTDICEPKLAERLSEGNVTDKIVTLTVQEPLPMIKELTTAVQDHWLDLLHAAIDKAAREQRLPRFKKAFVWIEVVTPKYTDNARLWDTSNRALNLIINNLKGVFFSDDNHEHMAFAVTGRWGEKGVTIVHIMTFDEWERFTGCLGTASS